MENNTNGANILADVAIIKAEMVHLRNDLNRVLRILVDNNGSSLVSRVAVLENQVKDDRTDISEMKAQSGAIKIAVITGILGVLGASIEIVFNILSRK